MAVQQWITPLKGIDSLSQTEAPMPAPGPSEVLVEIRAVSLNYRDVEGKSSAKHRPAGSILT
jgi:NADPH:quinone reductase-like Zn-dependent oxidoreductase